MHFACQVYGRFKFLSAMKVKNQVVRDVTSHRSVRSSRPFVGAFCLQHRGLCNRRFVVLLSDCLSQVVVSEMLAFEVLIQKFVL